MASKASMVREKAVFLWAKIRRSNPTRRFDSCPLGNSKYLFRSRLTANIKKTSGGVELRIFTLRLEVPVEGLGNGRVVLQKGRPWLPTEVTGPLDRARFKRLARIRTGEESLTVFCLQNISRSQENEGKISVSILFLFH
jgi:hypothetical protein